MSTRRFIPWLGLFVAGVAAVIAALLLLSRGGSTAPGSLAATAPREDPGASPAAPAPPGRAPLPAAGAPPQADAAPARAMEPAKRRVKAGWGKGRGELGRAEPSSGNPEGPTAVAWDASGRVLVLDRVNARVVAYDERGEAVGHVPTAVRSPQELLPTDDGHLLVLDRTADRTVAVHDAQGKLVGELPIEGSGVEDGGDVTGMFVEGDSVYVETGHAGLVRIGDTSGQPDAERPTLAGRPTRDGRALLRAELVDRAAGVVRVRLLDRQTGQERLARNVSLGTPLFAIAQLDSDRSGRVYLAVHAGRETPSGEVVGEELRVACLGPSLEPRGMARLPPNVLPDESFRDLAVTDDGRLLYMHRTTAGVTVDTYACAP